MMLERTIEQAVPVIDGYIEFEDRDIGVKYRVAVRQKQSLGAVYADKITEVSFEHMEIMVMMMHTEYMQTNEFTRQNLMSHLKMMRGPGGKEVKSSPFSARISELVRKGVLVKSKNKGNVTYHVNVEYAQKCMETKKF